MSIGRFWFTQVHWQVARQLQLHYLSRLSLWFVLCVCAFTYLPSSIIFMADTSSSSHPCCSVKYSCKSCMSARVNNRKESIQLHIAPQKHSRQSNVTGTWANDAHYLSIFTYYVTYWQPQLQAGKQQVLWLSKTAILPTIADNGRLSWRCNRTEVDLIQMIKPERRFSISPYLAVLRTCFIKKTARKSQGRFVPSSSSNLPSYWLTVRLAIVIARRMFILFVQLRSRTNSRQLSLRIMTPDFSRACHVTLVRVFLQGYIEVGYSLYIIYSWCQHINILEQTKHFMTNTDLRNQSAG